MRDTPNRPATPFTAMAVGLALMAAIMASDAVRGHGPGGVADWEPPLNLGPEVNSAFEDLAPHLSSDGLSLYFASTRPESAGGEDLWVARRAHRRDAWAPAVNLGSAINTPSNERSPALSRNRRLLFFATDRAGGVGGFDIWMSWRPDPDDDFAWQPPLSLGTAINSPATDAGPSFVEPWPWAGPRAAIPQLYMASSRPGGRGGLDLYVGSVPGGWAGPAMIVSELSSPDADLTPTVRRDGLEIVFASGRPGGSGGFDLWHSSRRSIHEPWSAPANLGPLVNSAANDVFPSIAVDARALVFQSARPGGFGGSDLYITTR